MNPQIDNVFDEQRGPGQIRRTHVGRVELGIAAEEPRLGVQASSLRVVLNLDVGAELVDQSIQGTSLRRPHVGGRHHPERLAALS